jgi:hypothetical protein
MLDSYAGEWQAKLKAENAHKEEMDSLRTINRNLSQHVYVSFLFQRSLLTFFQQEPRGIFGSDKHRTLCDCGT